MSGRRPPAPCLTRRRWTISDARSALAAWDASGASLRDFAIRAGLDVYRLYRWRRRLVAQDSISAAKVSPEFVELRPREVQPVEVVLPSGRVLRVPETIDAAALLRLVRALEED
jgi:hypothetical protein